MKLDDNFLAPVPTWHLGDLFTAAHSLVHAQYQMGKCEVIPEPKVVIQRPPKLKRKKKS